MVVVVVVCGVGVVVVIVVIVVVVVVDVVVVVVVEAFQRVFGDTIDKTKEACAEARRELGWPARIA